MSLGNTSLHQRGEIPEIVKLPNDRLRVIRRFTKFTREDIDNANLGSTMGDFGDLDTTGEQVANQGYADCRLISVEVDTRFNAVSNADNAVLVKTYETLTGSFVQITDDTVTFTENGLKQITRVYRAVSGTTSSNTVGTTTLGTGEILASSRIEDNNAFAELTETYIEAGTLSRTEDFVGSQDSLVIEAIGPDPSTPAGYSLASKQESNFEGFQTNRFTFLKDNVKLSRSEDKVGSQLAISEQWFNPDADKTVSGYSLATKSTSDFEGIETVEFRFLKNNVVLSRTTDLVGSQKSITVEVFNPNETPNAVSSFFYLQPDGTYLYLQPDDVSVYLQPDGDLAHLLAAVRESNVDGIPTKRYTFLKENVLLSQGEDEVGSQNAITEQWFKPDASRKIKTDYSLARTEASDVQGIPTERYTFLKDDVELSRSEDLVGSQLAITTRVFNPASDPTITGYSLARTEESDVDGIPAKQYTFLKPSILSVQQEFNEVRDRITVRAFSKTSAGVDTALNEVTANHKLVAESEDDFEGIKTSTYVYELDSHDVISTEENGLRTVTRSLILAAGTDYNKVVGTDTITHKIDPTDAAVTLYLAGFEIKDTSEFRLVTERYIEAGILSEVTEPGPVAGTVQVTRVSVGVESVPAGELISFRNERNNGNTIFTRTTIQGTITGVKQTYKDVVEVQVPGVVKLSKASGVAVLEVTPIRTKKVGATVTVEIVSTPTDAAQVAYDLSDVSCSVTATNISDKTGPGNTVTVTDGNTSATSSGFTRTKNVSARVLNYPGHYYSATSNPTTGAINYTSARVMRASGSVIGSDDYNASTTTSLKASGLGSAPGTPEGYYTTGVLRRKNRPILTTFQSASNPIATVYFEEITWSV